MSNPDLVQYIVEQAAQAGKVNAKKMSMTETMSLYSLRLQQNYYRLNENKQVNNKLSTKKEHP